MEEEVKEEEGAEEEEEEAEQAKEAEAEAEEAEEAEEAVQTDEKGGDEKPRKESYLDDENNIEGMILMLMTGARGT